MCVGLKDVKVFAVDIDGTLTENGCGMVYLNGIATLRFLEDLGLRVVYVTGRASIEAYLLQYLAEQLVLQLEKMAEL